MHSENKGIICVNNQIKFLDIKINLEIRHTACCKLYITKHDCTAGHTFKRYDDHIAWR